MTADVLPPYPGGGALGTVLTLAVAAFFACMGVYGLFKPKGVVERFGMTADTPDARAEVRAVYGGFGVAVAALLVGVLAFGSRERHAVWATVGIATLGMAFGRVTRVLERERAAFNPTWLFLLVELGIAAALAVAIALD